VEKQGNFKEVSVLKDVLADQILSLKDWPWLTEALIKLVNIKVYLVKVKYNII